MTDETPIIRALHKTYIERSGRDVNLDMGRLMAWNNWRSHGWDASDLEAVIALVKRRIREGKKWEGSLGFRSLIENTSHFEEMLAEARAWLRRPKHDTAREQVLQSTHRPSTQPTPPARPARDVIAEANALANFRKWRQEHDL